jgi:hypothetical protein
LDKLLARLHSTPSLKGAAVIPDPSASKHPRRPRSTSSFALEAAWILPPAGYTRVYSVADGFEGDGANGRKDSGSPWGYDIAQAKLPAKSGARRLCPAIRATS